MTAMRHAVFWIIAALCAQAAAADGMPPAQLEKKETSMESAKRRAPQAKPVVHKGVRYEQMRDPASQGFDQGGGVVAAIDVASGKQLWAVQVYKVTYDPREERDAQEIYLEDLRVDAKADTLVVRDERGRRFAIGLKDRVVRETR
jgi:hypothetical protein